MPTHALRIFLWFFPMIFGWLAVVDACGERALRWALRRASRGLGSAVLWPCPDWHWQYFCICKPKCNPAAISRGLAVSTRLLLASLGKIGFGGWKGLKGMTLAPTYRWAKLKLDRRLRGGGGAILCTLSALLYTLYILYTSYISYTLCTLCITHTREKGKFGAPKWKREKVGNLFCDRTALGNKSARTHERNETKRNYFPVGLTPNLRYCYRYFRNRLKFGMLWKMKSPRFYDFHG